MSTWQLLQAMHQRGMPVSALERVFPMVQVLDATSTQSTFGLSAIATWDNARFYLNNQVVYLELKPGLAPIVLALPESLTLFAGTIVLSPAHAQVIAQGNFFEADGRLTPSSRALLHELLHAVIALTKTAAGDPAIIVPSFGGLSDYDVEETFVDNFERFLTMGAELSNLLQIYKAGNATPQNISKINHLLKSYRT